MHFRSLDEIRREKLRNILDDVFFAAGAAAIVMADIFLLITLIYVLAHI